MHSLKKILNGDCKMNEIKFTGEFLVPEKVEKRLLEDHIARYEYAKKYSKNSDILDIACGYGYGSEILGLDCKSYTGVDIKKELIENARIKYGLNNKRVNFIEGDACTFASEKKYDLVVSLETIEHIQEYRKVVETLVKSVRSNGRLIVSSPNRPVTSPFAKTINDKPANIFHTQEFTPQELLNIFIETGLQAKEVKILGQRNSLFHFKNKWIITALDILRMNPDNRANTNLKSYKIRQPKYFVLDILVV